MLYHNVSGTTCLVALHKQDTLYVANVGDSRGVMCDADNNTVPLSFDHKPHQVGTLKSTLNQYGSMAKDYCYQLIRVKMIEFLCVNSLLILAMTIQVSMYRLEPR